ncbi:MAG: hypothetical protein AAGE65_06140 [Planctomycetota bacterium]
MLCSQTQPATLAFAGYPVKSAVVATLNPVCVEILSGLRMAFNSWQDRTATHATPVRPTVSRRPRK